MKSAIICFNCEKLTRFSESYQMKIFNYTDLKPEDGFIEVPKNASVVETEKLIEKMNKIATEVKVRVCRKCAKKAGYKVAKAQKSLTKTLKLNTVGSIRFKSSS